MKEIYLDNSATTKVYQSSAEKAMEMMTKIYGNPSSLHSKGIEAEHEIQKARQTIADTMSAEKEEIYFTSGGTEGNNLAIIGAVKALKRRGNRIVTTSIEHSSVIETMHELEKDGFEVIYLSPDKNGVINRDDIISAITSDTILVSIMTVNNEIGSIQPIECVRRAIQAVNSPALFHTDAVQAYMKMPVIPKKLGIDIMTVSGHKVHAPKGVGAIYIRKGVRILPIHFGGLQEKKIRPGTEPCPLICSFGTAVSELNNKKERKKHINDLNMYCREKLGQIKDIVINSDKNCLPYILNISAVGLRSETLLHFLAEHGIYVSSGSACAKGQKSHVLTSLGLPDILTDSAIRISFSDENNKEDIDILIKYLEEALLTLARTGKM